VFWSLGAGTVVLAAVVALVWAPALALGVLAVPFFYIAIVLTWTSHRLGPRGDNVQSRIHQLLIDSVGHTGRLLDIGCGSGQLLIRFAKAGPGDYVGLDYWGDDWSTLNLKPSATRRWRTSREFSFIMAVPPGSRSPTETSDGSSVA
jgi:SAM-dependent methyltransferase